MLLVGRNLKLVIWEGEKGPLILKYLFLKCISRQNNVFTSCHADHPLVGYHLEPSVVHEGGNSEVVSLNGQNFFRVQFEIFVDLKMYDSCMYLLNTNAK